MTTPPPTRALPPGTTTRGPTAPTLWTRTAERARSLLPTRDQVQTFPIVTRPLIGTPAEVANVLRNGTVLRHGPIRRMRNGDVKIMITVPDLADPAPPLPARWAITWDRAATRRAATIAGAVTATAGTLYCIGALVWFLYGAQIIAGLKATAGAAGLAAALAVAWWFLRHGRNGCPGLHCPGCGH